jgi:aminoglycoside phosphotransferase (APT) family kinase protein
MLNAGIPAAAPSPVQAPRKRAYTVDNSVYIKCGTGHQIQREVEAITFVGQQTSIPLPTILEVHIHEDLPHSESWFSMGVVDGSPLSNAWPLMEEEACRATQAELNKIFLELRAVPPPMPAYIGSCSGGPVYDHRLNNGDPCGPFTSESAFNDFLVAPVARCPKKELVNHYRRQLVDDHGVAFTHADLCGEHIFVEPATGRITGILDWEMAGWWPTYWEYTKSRYGDRYQAWWKVLVDNFLFPYEPELRIEEDLQQF